jgi:hypothetical protein
MSSLSEVIVNGADHHVRPESRRASLKHHDPATAALHADDPLNVVDDVAPPMHVSTTYRYPIDPEALFSVTERGVRAMRFPSSQSMTRPSPLEPDQYDVQCIN